MIMAYQANTPNFIQIWNGIESMILHSPAGTTLWRIATNFNHTPLQEWHIITWEHVKQLHGEGAMETILHHKDGPGSSRHLAKTVDWGPWVWSYWDVL